MRTPPADLETTVVAEAAASGWGLHLTALSYAALGGGSHHWTATTPDGVRYFLTVDDLLDKPWLGTDTESAFLGLQGTFGAARQLREQARLGFVLAPTRSADGQSVHRLTPRYSLAVFPFVEGETGSWGDDLPPDHRDQILRMVANLHGATPAVRSLARPRESEVYDREHLENALRALDQPWDGGPFAEPARQALAAQVSLVQGWLADFDRLAAYVAASGADRVITHGEPHGGNIMRIAGELLLIDWDTVALAPRERDLWMLDDGSPQALAAYTQATGYTPDARAVRYYRLAWRLADLSGFTRTLRSAHQPDGNAERAWSSLQLVLDSAPGGWTGPFRHVSGRGELNGDGAHVSG